MLGIVIESKYAGIKRDRKMVRVSTRSLLTTYLLATPHPTGLHWVS